MSKTVKNHDFQLNVRIPTRLKYRLDAHARVPDMTTSEMFRWLLDHAIYEDTENILAAVKDFSVQKNGPLVAATLAEEYEPEFRRIVAAGRAAR